MTPAAERAKPVAQKPTLTLSPEFKKQLQTVKENLKLTKISKTDLFGELEASSKKPFGLDSFLDKYWESGNIY